MNGDPEHPPLHPRLRMAVTVLYALPFTPLGLLIGLAVEGAFGQIRTAFVVAAAFAAWAFAYVWRRTKA